MNATTRFAGIELGGTKAIAVIAEGNRIIDRRVIPTVAPGQTLPALRAQLDRWLAEAPFAALGIASFGPIQLDPAHPDFGHILATPKPGWTGATVAATLTDGLACPWRIDTDVNGAALAEYHWGAGGQCTSLCYVTIGTGLGGGVLINGRAVHGAMHPEIGHLRLRRTIGDTFSGSCSFHGDCIEGLVCGSALRDRFGMDPAYAADTHPVWRHVAADIAELCGTILLTTAAQRILFGGSVILSRPFLLPWVREMVVDRLGTYLPFLYTGSAEQILQLAGLGTEAGPLGAIALAQAALNAAGR
ncbi:ROK family protein [Sphingomonas hylomeconis]|uniref:fructokinase n=1 Tax=Sphingomonas hylomeconis TaxID=1395958 RepID=A0ABV7SZL7_9SPHN|nr:ROK family protein [Sphingomonas hylomeconis]